MREYQNFLKQLKYVIVNSGVLEKEDKCKKIANLSHKVYVNAVVDLSHWNADVNFKLVKEDGILGVVHKATQGLKFVDPKYEERRKVAENEGLLWGAYHLGIWGNGKDQAEHFLDKEGDNAQTLFALDIQENQNEKDITPKQAEDFVTRVQERTNRLPLICGGAYFLKDFATPILTKCPLWKIRWSKLPKGWNKRVLWQYTNGQMGPKPHSVRGIGPCDRSKFNGTIEELKNFWLSGC
ncbi:MAG: glycoside hydrolase family 25 protein [Wolbachia pipientis]